MVQRGVRHRCRNGPQGALHNGACPLFELSRNGTFRFIGADPSFEKGNT